MYRATSMTRVLLFSALLLLGVLIGGGRSYAQQSAEDKVKAAQSTFHAALGALDMSRMAAVWAHDPNAMLINPRDKTIAIGWDAIQKDWEGTFNAWSQLNITPIDGPHIRVEGNLAWLTGIVTAAGKLKSGADISAPTFEETIFEQRGGQWLIVSHSAWRMPQ